MTAVATGKCKLYEIFDMVDITLFEVHFEDGTFSTNLPFRGLTDSEDVEIDEEAPTEESDDSGSGRGMVLLGIFVLLVIGTAVVKYLSGDDETPEVSIDTDEKSAAVSAE